jgi:hypothetical protein
MRQRQFAALALSGTVVLAGWVIAGLTGLDLPDTDREAKRTTSLTEAGRVDIAPVTTMAAMAAVETSHPELSKPAVALTADSTGDVATADAAPATTAATPATLSVAEVATVDPDPPAPVFVLASVSATEVPVVEDSLDDSGSSPPPAPRVRLASLFTSDPGKEYPTLAARPVETPNECLIAEICIDEYLWSLYERTPKVDTNKVTERIKTTVKIKGKTRTVIKTNVKYVLGDFTWKDPIAAQRVGMSLMDYVIGGMDRSFKVKLYRALRAMDDAGLMPGITSAFRDDYRQAIASGKKAASDSSYHGGSRRGGYGHGLAVDLVSVKGETRMQRFASSEELWKWIDAHEKELGVGRPYRDRDPPHIGPLDGKEYVVKRGGRPNVQRAGLQTKKAPKQTKSAHKPQPIKSAQKPQQANSAHKPQPTKSAQKPQQAKSAQKSGLETKKPQAGTRNDHGAKKRAEPAKPSKVSSLQDRASVQH